MDKGQPMDNCPWKNPYQFRKHRPKPEIEAEARKILEGKN
jgi:hypothetical protein